MMVSAIGQADLDEQFQRPLSRLAIGNIAIGERHHHVFHGTGPRQQIETLEDESDFNIPQRCPLVGGVVGDFLIIQPILPGGRPIQTTENVHQRAFSRPRLAHQRHQFATGHAQRHALEHRDLNLAQEIRLVDVLQLDEIHQRPPPPPPPPAPPRAPPPPAPPPAPPPPPPPPPGRRPNCGANGLVPPAAPPEASFGLTSLTTTSRPSLNPSP